MKNIVDIIQTIAIVIMATVEIYHLCKCHGSDNDDTE